MAGAGFVAFKENGQDLVDFGFQRGQITRDSRCRDGILRTMAACYIAERVIKKNLRHKYDAYDSNDPDSGKSHVVKLWQQLQGDLSKPENGALLEEYYELLDCSTKALNANGDEVRTLYGGAARMLTRDQLELFTSMKSHLTDSKRLLDEFIVGDFSTRMKRILKTLDGPRWDVIYKNDDKEFIESVFRDSHRNNEAEQRHMPPIPCIRDNLKDFCSSDFNMFDVFRCCVAGGTEVVQMISKNLCSMCHLYPSAGELGSDYCIFLEGIFEGSDGSLLAVLDIGMVINLQRCTLRSINEVCFTYGGYNVMDLQNSARLGISPKLLRENKSVGGKLAYSCDHVDISATNSTIWNCRMLSIEGNNANRSGLLYTSFLNFEELEEYQKRWIQDSTNQENPSVETFEDCFNSMYYLDRKSDLDCNAYVRAIKYSDIRYQTFTNDENSDTILVRKRRTRTGEKILFLSMASMRDKILMYSSLSNHIHRMRYQQFYGTINRNGEEVKVQNSFQRAVAYSDLIANDHSMVVERDDGYWVQALNENGEAYHVDHIDGNRVNNVATNLQVITAAENIRRSAKTRDYASASANMKSVKLVFMPEEHSFDISHGESIPGKMEWEWCSPVSSNKEQVEQTWTLTIGHYFREKDGHLTWDHHGTAASLFCELKGLLDVWNVFLRDLNMENGVLYNLSLAESLPEFRQLLTQTFKPSGMRKGRGSNAKGFDCAVGEQPIQLCHIHKKGLPFQVFSVYCRLRAVSTQPQAMRTRVTIP